MIPITHDTRTILIPDALAGYAPDIEQKFFDVFWNCVEETRPGVCDFSAPAFHRYRFDGRPYFLPSLPEESPLSLDYLRYYHPTGKDMCFDLGAYAGVNTIYLAQRFGFVVALEPDPISMSALGTNIRNSDVSNIYRVPLAINTVKGSQLFNSEGTPGASLSDGHRWTFGTRIEVQTVTMENLIEQYGRPDFIKMDIEGDEARVLEGCASRLHELGTMLAIDTHHFRDGRLTTEDVERCLCNAGYKVVSSDESGVWTTWTTEV